MNVIDGDDLVDHGHWHELPVELMGEILLHTDIIDRMRMSMVCKSWQSILKRNDIPIPPQFPWLIHPHFPENGHISFSDKYHDRLHCLKLPDWVKDARCCGSSKGWLIMHIPLEDQIFLFNPISRANHKLPSMKSCHDNLPLSPPLSLRDMSGKIILSSEDPLNCVVAIMYQSKPPVVAVCTVGGKSWSVYTEVVEDDLLQDISFSTMGVLYVLKCTKQVNVTPCSFTIPNCQVTLKFISLSPFNPIFKLDHGEQQLGFKHVCTIGLVESDDGQLVLIQKFGISQANEKDAYKTRQIKVYKLDPHTDTSHLTKVTNLGNQILLYSVRGSIFVQAGHFNELKKNCIHFFGDRSVFRGVGPDESSPIASPSDSGVFHIDNGRIEPFLPSFKTPLSPHVGWFTPIPL